MSEAASFDSLPALSEEEKSRLHLWAQATPGQRLAWLEEALRLSALAKNRASQSQTDSPPT
ncbi:MAG: hypothetical protein HZA59_10510 [Hydrogenophilales bacterium]|nr:hypothetical protein [Hydrogenophilales bacterium]